MHEGRAKRLLRKMLDTYTTGSVLHLLADLHHEAAEKAKRSGDGTAFDRHRSAERTLYVVGLGVDAACPT